MRRSLVGFALILALFVGASCESPGPKGVIPPDWHPMYKVRVYMSDTEVRSILGDPQKIRRWPASNYWNPFYWGPDQLRVEWKYTGMGRIIFSQNIYSPSSLKVLRIDYDPLETGE